jgi:Uma2 family endonuclease
LVVEILSPGTRRRDLTVKRELYARFGVREYWIVDPANRSLTVLELTGDHYRPAPPRDDQAVPSRVLPGLDLTLDAIFADLR